MFSDPTRRYEFTADTSPEDIIRFVDEHFILPFFHKSGSGYPAAIIFAESGKIHVLNLIHLFTEIDRAKAAAKKLALAPTIQQYIASQLPDGMARAYVFVCDGYGAEHTKRSERQRARGVPVSKMSDRYPIILYTCEVYSAAGDIQRLYAEREKQKEPGALLDFEFWPDDGRAQNRLGFGGLKEKKES